jgi:hypothetical protein
METIQFEAPQTISDTGIDRALIRDLALKILFLGGEMSLVDLAARTCLSWPVVEDIFRFFRKEQLCEVKGMVRGVHVIIASALGKERASGLLDIGPYAGPAPVSLKDYNKQVCAQTVHNMQVTPHNVTRAFDKLVLGDDMLTRLGIAATSGTSIFLYGPSGTGKTTIGCNLPSIYDDFVLLPHALEVDRQVIPIYDPGVHQRADRAVPEEWDRRWILCRRPRVISGGELSVEMLDLQFNSSSRFFTAPLQLKANNGVFLVDDFGRQRMRPEELLNRWMTPLERRMDFLSLPGGKKFEVPFDVLVVFSTNLDPRTLADEAFLRRIPNRINVTYASREQFMEIFRRECSNRKLTFAEDLPGYVADLIANEMNQTLAQSHVRDLINQIFWTATYLGVTPRLTRDTLKKACDHYFLPAAKV